MCTHCTTASLILGSLLLDRCLLTINLLAELSGAGLIFHDLRIEVLSRWLVAIHHLVLMLVVHVLLLHVALLGSVGSRLVRSKMSATSITLSYLTLGPCAAEITPSSPVLRAKIAVLVAWGR